MVSFIVIGKNEGFKLELAIASIFNFIEHNAIQHFEVIYVDSKSRDGSAENLERKGFKIKIARLLDDCNAAIGRNVGATLAKGDILFFLDGDMELNPNFDFQRICDLNRGYFLFSGQIINIKYTPDFKIKTGTDKYYKNLIADREELFFGGLFIISSRLWKEFGGMRNNFVYGEDIDLSMRLSEKGYRLLRFKDVLAFHHTTSKKMSLMELIRNACYSRGYLYRKNILNRITIKRIMRSDPTVPVLILCILTFSILNEVYFIYGYFIVLTVAVAFKEHRRFTSFFLRLFQQFIRDVFVIISALFYYPKAKSEKFALIYEKD